MSMSDPSHVGFQGSPSRTLNKTRVSIFPVRLKLHTTVGGARASYLRRQSVNLSRRASRHPRKILPMHYMRPALAMPPSNTILSLSRGAKYVRGMQYYKQALQHASNANAARRQRPVWGHTADSTFCRLRCEDDQQGQAHLGL